MSGVQSVILLDAAEDVGNDLKAAVEFRFDTAQVARQLPGAMRAALQEEQQESRDLAATADRPLGLAQKITYCLRKMGAIESAGKRGGALLYIAPNPER